MGSRKATQEDFEIFKAEVLRLVEKFHIDDWTIVLKFEPLKGNNAEISTIPTAHHATIKFSTTTTLNDADEIRWSALHEVCHLLLSEISDVGWERWATIDQMKHADESTANKLASLFNELGV